MRIVSKHDYQSPKNIAHSKVVEEERLKKESAWRVIAKKPPKARDWKVTSECPYRDDRDPLRSVQRAVENGDLITAQKKVGPNDYELWAKTPVNRW